MSRPNSLRIACALTWTLPNAHTCSTKISRTLASGLAQAGTAPGTPSSGTGESRAGVRAAAPLRTAAWGATLAVMPVLFDPSQLLAEQLVMADLLAVT